MFVLGGSFAEVTRLEGKLAVVIDKHVMSRYYVLCAGYSKCVEAHEYSVMALVGDSGGIHK